MGDGGIVMRRTVGGPARVGGRHNWGYRAAALLLGGMLIVGCSEENSDWPAAGPEQPASAGSPALVRLSLTSECVTTADLEGAFSSSADMDDYLECILPILPDWAKSAYSQMPMPDGFLLVPTGHSSLVGTQASGCPLDDGVLLYCEVDRQVYLGEQAVWGLYTHNGDAAPVLVSAHELTHHFQLMVKMPRAATYNEQIRYENQADCGAGAFMNFANKQGYVDPNDDIKDLADALNAAGEAEGPDQSHGTSAERLAAFDTAFLSTNANPLVACNSFTPDHQLINPTP